MTRRFQVVASTATAVLLLYSLVSADEYPRTLVVPRPNSDSSTAENVDLVAVSLQSGAGLPASFVDDLFEYLVRNDAINRPQSHGFRMHVVASWSDRVLVLIEEHSYGDSKQWLLVSSFLDRRQHEVLWSGDFPGDPTSVGFGSIAEAPDRGLIIFSVTNIREQRQILVVDFMGNEHGLLEDEVKIFSQQRLKNGREIAVMVASRVLNSAECPPGVNDEALRNNEALITQCFVGELQPVVYWATGCSQLPAVQVVFGCQMAYCGPLPGEPVAEDLVPESIDISALPESCTYWQTEDSGHKDAR